MVGKRREGRERAKDMKRKSQFPLNKPVSFLASTTIGESTSDFPNDQLHLQAGKNKPYSTRRLSYYRKLDPKVLFIR